MERGVFVSCEIRRDSFPFPFFDIPREADLLQFEI